MSNCQAGFQTLSTVMGSITEVDQTLNTKIHSVLEIAADKLGFPVAYFTDIDDQTQRIVASVGDHNEVYDGAVDPVEQSYCRKTIKSESPVVVADAEAEGWGSDTAYQKFGFSCYIGAPVTVAGDTYGTICFADNTERPDIDSAVLKPTVESLARIIGYEIARTRSEEEVERQQQRYQNLFKESRDAILLLGADGIRECNASAQELFDVNSKEQLVGKIPRDMSSSTQPDWTGSSTSFAQHVETATTDGEAFFEWKFCRPSGENFVAEVKLSRIEFDGETLIHTHIRDITERKQQQKNLRLFKSALEQAGHGVAITNREGEIQYANPAFEEDTGYEQKEILGKNPRFSKSGKHDETFYEKLWETICAGEVWETDELINRRKSGELYHVDQTIAPITDQTGEITHFVAIQNDITDLRLREQRLDVLNRILRHNLRNCMTVIQGNLSAIESMGDNNEALKKYITPINKRIENLISISNKAAKLESLLESNNNTDTRLDLKNIVDSVATELSAEYPHASITTTVPETEVTISYNSSVEFAISEAVENAIVHNDKTDNIEVTIELFDLPTWVGIRIIDNGPGIPEQEKMSLEVGKENNVNHASSIGLWVIYWIVKDSGGDIMISENKSSGTTIDMILPCGES